MVTRATQLGWRGEEAVRKYKKGEDLEAVVLAIDVERERISLGVKQLSGDPFSNFAHSHEKGSVVVGTVKSVDAKGAVARYVRLYSKGSTADEQNHYVEVEVYGLPAK